MFVVLNVFNEFMLGVEMVLKEIHQSNDGIFYEPIRFEIKEGFGYDGILEKTRNSEFHQNLVLFNVSLAKFKNGSHH